MAFKGVPFTKKFYWGIVYLPGIYTFRTGNGLKGGKGQMRIQSELSYWRHSEF